MKLDQGGDSEPRFAEYVAGLGSVIGHVERTRPLRDYCTGLMLPGERKSVEPMAARTAPARTAAQHQSLLHFVANATWSDEDVLAKVRRTGDDSPLRTSFRRASPGRSLTRQLSTQRICPCGLHATSRTRSHP